MYIFIEVSDYLSRSERLEMEQHTMPGAAAPGELPGELLLKVPTSTYHSMTNRFTNNAQFILLLLFCIYRVLFTFRSIEYVTRFRLGTT